MPCSYWADRNGEIGSVAVGDFMSYFYPLYYAGYTYRIYHVPIAQRSEGFLKI